MSSMPEIPALESQPPTQEFRLDEVLTVVSGTNFLNVEGDPDPNAFTRRTGDLLSFMTDEGQLETHQLPRIADEVKDAVTAEHPEIADLLKDMPEEPPLNASAAEEAAFDKRHKAWYNKIMAAYGDRMGDSITLSPIKTEAHTHVEADDEFRLMGGQVDYGLDAAIAAADAKRQADYEQAAEAAQNTAPDIPENKLPKPYTGESDPYKDVVRGAEYLTQQSGGVGEQAERYSEADYAARWAKHLEDPEKNPEPVAHPGQTALTYHMSKALDDEQRRRIMDTYVNDPSKLRLPPELQ